MPFKKLALLGNAKRKKLRRRKDHSGEKITQDVPIADQHQKHRNKFMK